MSATSDDSASSNYPTPNFSIDLSGQVAFVTGTTSGLGRRFADVLAACGAKVALSGRRADRLEEHATELRARGTEVAVVPLDMNVRFHKTLAWMIAAMVFAHGTSHYFNFYNLSQVEESEGRMTEYLCVYFLSNLFKKIIERDQP